MYVKICGLSNWIDADFAAREGADGLGFVMGGKVLPPEVEPHAQVVRQMIKLLPKNVDTFIVTHLKNADDILALATYVNSSGIQISEDVGVSVVKEVRTHTKRKIIKTVPVVDKKISLKKLQSYEKLCDFILLDTTHGGYTGGTGVTNDWNLCKFLVTHSSKPVLLAGGLTPVNLKEALSIVKPAGADVSTGVSEYSDIYLRKDRKDPAKIHEFVRIAKSR